MPVRLAFIRPLSPSAAVRPPKGDDWLHEPKWDGFRFGKLPTQSAILDGELVLIDPRGGAHFYALMHQMRTRGPEKPQLDQSRKPNWKRINLERGKVFEGSR